MTKRFISELNTEELTKVFENNAKLRQDILEDAHDSVNFFAEDIVKCFSRESISWQISSYGQGDYIEVKNTNNFIAELIQVQKSYAPLNKDMEKFLYETDLNIDELNEMDYEDEHYDDLEKIIEDNCDELADALLKYFRDDYDYYYKDENLLDYFLEFYAEERMDKGFYVNDDFELYEHIEYEKSYK